MYALIIVIGMLSQGAGSAVMPVGVTSQIVGKFKNLESARQLRVSPTREALFQISVCQPRGESTGIAHTPAETSPVCQGETRKAFGTRAPVAIHCS